MVEAPVFFYGPEDELPSVDPYEEFVVEEEATEPEPDITPSVSETISSDVTDTLLTAKEVVERTALSLENEATALVDMGVNTIDDIIHRMDEESNIEKDFFFDHDGVKHIKDKSLPFDKLSNIVSGVDSVFGVLCVNGLNDLDFNISFSTSAFKDLFSNGLFSFAKCFIEKATTEGLNSVIQDALIATAVNGLSSDTPNAISFIKDSLDPGIVELLNTDMALSVVEKYQRPSSQPTLASDLDKMVGSLDSIRDDWFIRGETQILDTFSHASEDASELFYSSEKYFDSSVVAQTYNEITEFDSFLP